MFDKRWSLSAHCPLSVFPLFIVYWFNLISIKLHGNLHTEQMRRKRMKMDLTLYVWMSKTFMLIRWGMLSVRSNIGRSMKDSASFMKISWICTRYQNWIWIQTEVSVKILWSPWASLDYLSTRQDSVPYTSPSPDREITLQ